jgi:drug/metabolite transporter (DMT)-like permease
MREREMQDGEIGAEATGPVPGWGWTEAALTVMVLVWGINFAVAKQALDSFEPLGFNAIRFVVASAFVGVVLRMQGPLPRPEPRHVPRILVLGLVGNLAYQMAFILGLARTHAGHAALMLALTPVATALLSRATGAERPGARTWTGAALSIVGVALVTGSGAAGEGATSVLTGDLILLVAAATWALYTVGSRPLVQHYGSVAVTAWTMWVGTVALVAAGIPALLHQDWGRVGTGAWGGLLYSAIFSLGLAYLIWYRGVERLGNTRTAIFSNLTPVVALAFSALWLGERPSALALAGAALTLVGVSWVRTDRTAAKSPDPDAVEA